MRELQRHITISDDSSTVRGTKMKRRCSSRNRRNGAAMSSSQINPFKDYTQAGPVDTPVVNQTSPLALTIWSKEGSNTATMPHHVFPTNRESPETEEILDVTARNWLRVTKNEQDEQDRLKTLETDVIRAFKRDEFKNASAVTEVVYLAPILESDDYRYLLKESYSGIDTCSNLKDSLN
ncbi:MAG: hypothetical protein J3Q66DRAFT_97830 [Benniella sp.]|nr:MAG: hypothetical protein J3Q66DRAFT_97830 [Benniella sp.]